MSAGNERARKRFAVLTIGLVALFVTAAGGLTAWLLMRAFGEPGGRDPSTVESVARSRQSSIPALKPFDPAAFQTDPEPYLRTVEPGRAFQTKQPKGPDDVRLTAVGASYLALSPGEKVALRVKGAPFAPVTFTSFNGGMFEESKLGSVTARADQEGLAKAHFTAGPGIRGDIRIQAGSPLAVGVQVFMVRVVDRR